MKLSHIFLLGVSLLSFQAHAMEPDDSVKNIDGHKIKTSQKNPSNTKTLNPYNINEMEIQPSLQKPNIAQAPFPDEESTQNKRKRKKKKPSALTDLPQQNHTTRFDYTEQGLSKQSTVIRLPKKIIIEILPAVETFIQKVIQERREEPLTVHVLLNPEDILSFHEAFGHLVQKYPFPFTWSTTNKGPSHSSHEDPYWIVELSLASLAKQRERVEKEFVYKISEEDKKIVDWQNIYDVAMRSSFTLEDFKFNNSIKVRTIGLNGVSETEDLQTFQYFLEHILLKDENPFHIISITFNRKAKGHYAEMYDVFLRKISDVNAAYHRRGTVFDSQNGFLYLCLDNSHRKMLDLHGGRSVKQAEQETKDFILQAYEAFHKDITLFTGRGNHVNANGQKGVLREVFGDWMKTEPFPKIVKRFSLVEGEGGYKVIFKKIQNLNLSNIPVTTEGLVLSVKQTIDQMVQQKKTRLHVMWQSQESSSIHDKEFNLITSLYTDLHANHKELISLISPLSFEATSGRMKVIFNKKHSKSPSSFSFVNSYGSKSLFGAIG